MTISSDWVTPGVPFNFEIVRKGTRVVIIVDGTAVKHFLFGGELTRVGFCSYEGTLRIHDFYVRGETIPIDWNRTQPIAISIPTIDVSDEEHRQVVVDKQAGQYVGHPDTVLMPDNRTMFCTYPLGHGGPAPLC